MTDSDLHLSPEHEATLAALTSPERIQAYLDTLKYPSGPENRRPARVMAEGQAHCLDGALFAAFPYLVMRDTNLSIGARMTYAFLLVYAWQEGSCYPKQITMAKAIGLSRSDLPPESWSKK